MTCPICGGDNKCIGTVGECDAIYRKRVCNVCGHIFYTIECDIDSPDEYLRVFNKIARERKAKKRKEKQK